MMEEHLLHPLFCEKGSFFVAINSVFHFVETFGCEEQEISSDVFSVFRFYAPLWALLTIVLLR